jgi:hypothetical protein
MTFGNPFGLALYDKQQRQVSSAAAATPAAEPNGAKHPMSGVADSPLQPAPISGLQEQIRPLFLLASRPSPRASALPSRCPMPSLRWRV